MKYYLFKRLILLTSFAAIVNACLIAESDGPTFSIKSRLPFILTNYDVEVRKGPLSVRTVEYWRVKNDGSSVEQVPMEYIDEIYFDKHNLLREVKRYITKGINAELSLDSLYRYKVRYSGNRYSFDSIWVEENSTKKEYHYVLKKIDKGMYIIQVPILGTDDYSVYSISFINGRLSKIILYADNKGTKASEIYLYNNDEMLIGKMVYDFKTGLITLVIFYDTNQLEILSVDNDGEKERNNYNEDGLLSTKLSLSHQMSYVYSMNKYGDWIEKSVFDSSNTSRQLVKEKRQIRYQ